MKNMNTYDWIKLVCDLVKVVADRLDDKQGPKAA